MKKEFPSRYYMEGIAEANVIGMAAGMAMDGFIPYVNTIATFITRRCYEQVAVDLCLHDLPVRLIGNGGGYVYAPLGPTHQAIEDIAIMRALPHMTVTAVCDAEEMTRLMDATLDWPHPIYIRLGKGGDPVISKPERGFAIGKAIDMIDGEQEDRTCCWSATGVATTAGAQGRGRAGGGWHPLPAAARPYRQAARPRRHRRGGDQDGTGRHGRGAQRRRRSGQRGARGPVGRDDGRAAAGQAARHSRPLLRSLRQPASVDGGLRHRREGHRLDGAATLWRNCSSEQCLRASGATTNATWPTRFMRDGYVVLPAESRDDLDAFATCWPTSRPPTSSCRWPEDKGAFLDRIHEKVDVQRLNDLRLAVIREMNEEPWTQGLLLQHGAARLSRSWSATSSPCSCASISASSCPNDDSSLLPVHADVWSGDSPYEVVLWVPYVHVYGTKTMFILPRDKDARYQARMGELKLKSAEELYRTIEPDLRWLDIPYGNVLLFTQNVMHGNIVNREAGDAVVEQLPLQERVLAVSRQEARRVLRADPGPAGDRDRRQLQAAFGRLMQTNQKGYRGYVFSRSVDNHRVPQHIQNLVIRDYAQRRKLALSAERDRICHARTATWSSSRFWRIWRRSMA